MSVGAGGSAGTANVAGRGNTLSGSEVSESVPASWRSTHARGEGTPVTSMRTFISVRYTDTPTSSVRVHPSEDVMRNSCAPSAAGLLRLSVSTSPIVALPRASIWLSATSAPAASYSAKSPRPTSPYVTCSLNVASTVDSSVNATVGVGGNVSTRRAVAPFSARLPYLSTTAGTNPMGDSPT